MFKKPIFGGVKTHTLEQKGGMNKVADENVKEKNYRNIGGAKAYRKLRQL